MAVTKLLSKGGNKLDLFSMECYLCVVKHLNLSLASKEMFISQPAMSLKISALEDELGVKLLRRSRQKIELTDSGKYVEKEFAYILNHYETLRDNAQKIHFKGNNRLSIGYHGPAEWADVNNLIQDFHKKYPQIEIDVIVDGWGPLTAQLINGTLDVLFTESSEIQDISVIDSEFLFRDYSAVAVSKSSPLAKNDKIDPKYLIREKIVMSNNQSAARTLKAIHQRLRDAGFDMDNAKLVDTYEITIAMASAGMGIAPIPRSFKIKGHQSVNFVDIDSDITYLDFVLAWSNGNENFCIPLFKDFCKSQKW